jgi:1-acyl-sn-glycerol-3-phosphate acyltransferase
MATRTSLRIDEPEQATDGANLPAVRRDDLRRHLPGIEPDRQLNDWGRSERIEGLLDKTLVDFFYRYWFRCEVEGIENVPTSGGALLVSNHSGGFVEAAMRARTPIVPVCVVGAEEAAPVFAQVKPLQRLTGLLYFPITPTFPHGGLLGMLGYLPAKFKIRFLEPMYFDEEGLHEDKALVQTVAHEVRARIQENLFDMIATRKSVWFG